MMHEMVLGLQHYVWGAALYSREAFQDLADDCWTVLIEQFLALFSRITDASTVRALIALILRFCAFLRLGPTSILCGIAKESFAETVRRTAPHYDTATFSDIVFRAMSLDPETIFGA
jgi:hypothetical protein